MSWFPDMGCESMIASGDHVRAVGWLDPNYPYAHGTVPTEFVTRLKEFTGLASHCAERLRWGIWMGCHTCDFCKRAHGLRNIGVPAGDLLFVAPEMVAHYVEQHGYAPPTEFVAAVMASPLPDTQEYRLAVEVFRRIHMRQLEVMGQRRTRRCSRPATRKIGSLGFSVTPA